MPKPTILIIYSKQKATVIDKFILSVFFFHLNF